MSKNEIERVSNPLAQSGNFAAATQENTMGAVASAGEVARVQAQLVYAASRPRDERKAVDRMLTAFQRPSLAKISMYQYAKGKTDVTGLSIRAAEAMAMSWGNMDFGSRELERKYGESTAEAYAWDLETNVRRSITFRVPHSIDTKEGRKKLESDRDIYEYIQNQAARRVRACLLSVLPRDIQDAVMEQAKSTLAATFDLTPEYLKGWLNAFKKIGVTKEMIEKTIQRDYTAITPAQMVGLVNKYNSIKDGMAVVSDFFEVETPAGDKAQTLAGKAAAAAAEKKPETAEPEKAADSLV